MAVAANLLFSGRLALVTGGGSGIGRAVCAAFAREGARVAVIDVNKDSAEKTVSLLPQVAQHKSFRVNVSSSYEVSSLMDQVKDHFQSVPCAAVHAAGITRNSFLTEMEEDKFDEVINVNLKGTFLINQALGRAMSEEKVKDGSIVNISSIVGKIGNRSQTNYAASKAGVIGFTQSAARELSRYNIRVNCVLPGIIETPMLDTVPENMKQTVIMMTALKRIGSPKEVAEVCVFLASTKSSYITGAAIEVTGGLNF